MPRPSKPDPTAKHTRPYSYRKCPTRSEVERWLTATGGSMANHPLYKKYQAQVGTRTPNFGIWLVRHERAEFERVWKHVIHEPSLWPEIRGEV